MIGWAALRALLGSWLGRIGGWLMLALTALAWLWVRDRRAEQRGKAEATADIERANIRKREEMAAVPRPDDAEVERRMRDGKF